MHMRHVSSLTAVCLTVLTGACAGNSPTEPQAGFLPNPLPLSTSAVPVTASGLPVLEFSIDLTGPARDSVVTKATPYSADNHYTARGPASWTFALQLVRDDGATYVLQSCSYGGSSGGEGTIVHSGGSTDFMDGSAYLFSQGHVINAVAFAKYSASPSDYAQWVSNGWLPGPDPVYTGARPSCIFSGEPTKPGSTSPFDRTLRIDQATERRDIPLNWRVE